MAIIGLSNVNVNSSSESEQFMHTFNIKMNDTMMVLPKLNVFNNLRKETMLVLQKERGLICSHHCANLLDFVLVDILYIYGFYLIFMHFYIYYN